jgi:hypothetical protein
MGDSVYLMHTYSSLVFSCMPHRYAFAVGLLLSLPSAGSAQGVAPTPTPRYYVGLAAYSSKYQYVGGNSFRELRVPVQVTAGYQFQPQLAVQLGVAYSQSTFDYSKQESASYPPGSFIVADKYFGKSIWRHTSVSVLGRYTLTRPSAHRLQADVLGGVTLEKERQTTAYQYTTIDSTNAVHSSSQTMYGYTYAIWLLTAGLSTRYRVSQHLEAVLDATLNARLGSLTSPPSLSGALGLRYRFGR